MYKIFFLLSLFIALNATTIGQESHFGAYYSYGAYFNIHKTNTRPLRPSDGSAIGFFYHLDNGEKALGFRASFAWRSNDIAFPIQKNLDVINNLKAVELKLQCILPATPKSSFALGISPRLVYHSAFSKIYYNSNRHATYEEQITMNGVGIDLNELNSALSMSWILKVSKHFQFALNLDQDMLPLYRSSAAFVSDEIPQPVFFNARLTSLTGSLILNLR